MDRTRSAAMDAFLHCVPTARAQPENLAELAAYFDSEPEMRRRLAFDATYKFKRSLIAAYVDQFGFTPAQRDAILPKFSLRVPMNHEQRSTCWRFGDGSAICMAFNPNAKHFIDAIDGCARASLGPDAKPLPPIERNPVVFVVADPDSATEKVREFFLGPVWTAPPDHGRWRDDLAVFARAGGAAIDPPFVLRKLREAGFA